MVTATLRRSPGGFSGVFKDFSVMSCGNEARLPTAEVRRLWNELRILNETLSEGVETAEGEALFNGVGLWLID